MSPIPLLKRLAASIGSEKRKMFNEYVFYLSITFLFFTLMILTFGVLCYFDPKYAWDKVDTKAVRWLLLVTFGLTIAIALTGCCESTHRVLSEEQQVYGETYSEGVRHPTWQESVFNFLGIK